MVTSTFYRHDIAAEKIIRNQNFICTAGGQRARLRESKCLGWRRILELYRSPVAEKQKRRERACVCVSEIT